MDQKANSNGNSPETMNDSVHELARLMLLIETHKERLPNGLPVRWGMHDNRTYPGRLVIHDNELQVMIGKSNSLIPVGNAYADGTLRNVESMDYDSHRWGWEFIETYE